MLFALIALIAVMLANSNGSRSAEKWPVPIPAQPVVMTIPINATVGFHNTTFVTPSVSGRKATVYVRYEIVQGPCLRIAEIDRGTNIAYLANAVRLDLETSEDYYDEISESVYPFGNSSVSLDDVPSSFHILYPGGSFGCFINADSPAIRWREYGIGAGAIENRYDTYRAIE
jgi:hypothetical protein